MRLCIVVALALGHIAPAYAQAPAIKEEVKKLQGTWVRLYVEVDGTARELHADERAYLETDFEGGDGARPYVKSKYEQRDGSGGPADVGPAPSRWVSS